MNGTILIESILTTSASILLTVFTYVIPLLSSIRTIHNRDKESYNQWLTYWLLIFLLTPLFNILKFYKAFHLSLVLWLSLPKFQGATKVYNELFLVHVLDKYELETKVDDKIYKVKSSITKSLLNIAKDIGWGVLYQIGGIVSYVQDTAASLVEDNNNNNNHYQQQPLKKKSWNEFNYDENNNNNIYDSNKSLYHQASISSKINQTKPVHSIVESFSSLPSTMDSSLSSTSMSKHSSSSTSSSSYQPQFDSIIEQESYIYDFINMLQKGLYVFAWYSDAKVITLSDRNGNPITKRKTEGNNNFKLRVFALCYPDRENNNINNSCSSNNKVESYVKNHIPTKDDEESYFVLGSVESRPGEEGVDIVSFPLRVVTEVKQSSRGIQFLTSSSLLHQDNANVRRNVSKDKNDTIVDVILAEIVLSDDKDRNILLSGLKALLLESTVMKNRDKTTSGLVERKGDGKSDSFDSISIGSN